MVRHYPHRFDAILILFKIHFFTKIPCLARLIISIFCWDYKKEQHKISDTAYSLTMSPNGKKGSKGVVDKDKKKAFKHSLTPVIPTGNITRGKKMDVIVKKCNLGIFLAWTYDPNKKVEGYIGPFIRLTEDDEYAKKKKIVGTFSRRHHDGTNTPMKSGYQATDWKIFVSVSNDNTVKAMEQWGIDLVRGLNEAEYAYPQYFRKVKHNPNEEERALDYYLLDDDIAFLMSKIFPNQAEEIVQDIDLLKLIFEQEANTEDNFKRGKQIILTEPGMSIDFTSN